MKLATKTTATLSADPLIVGAKNHFQAAAEALRNGCAEALITGLHLYALHARSNASGTRNDLVSVTGPQGFEAACDEIGIPKRTAYRWMNACCSALQRACLVMDGDDIAAEMPEPGLPRWETWEKELRKVASGMSLNRLLLGTTKASTEDSRYDELISGEENGHSRAIDLLQCVAEGRYTLAQAVKALGSLEAYDRLRNEGGDKIRKDPVYLDFDPVTKRSVGLIPKAFTTLHNGFKHWDDYDADARSEMKGHWREVLKTAPLELTELLRK